MIPRSSSGSASSDPHRTRPSKLQPSICNALLYASTAPGRSPAPCSHGRREFRHVKVITMPDLVTPQLYQSNGEDWRTTDCLHRVAVQQQCARLVRSWLVAFKSSCHLTSRYTHHRNILDWKTNLSEAYSKLGSREWVGSIIHYGVVYRIFQELKSFSARRLHANAPL
jgi:hypothetical protein